MAEFALNFWNRVDDMRGSMTLKELADKAGVNYLTMKDMRSRCRFPKGYAINQIAEKFYNDTYLMNITKVDDTHYTIKSKIGNYGPTGTTDVASWSTDLINYQISNATSITGAEDITTNINTENNPCMIRFANPSGSFLIAGGSASGLKFATGTGAWSVWNLWLIDGTTPS